MVELIGNKHLIFDYEGDSEKINKQLNEQLLYLISKYDIENSPYLTSWFFEVWSRNIRITRAPFQRTENDTELIPGLLLFVYAIAELEISAERDQLLVYERADGEKGIISVICREAEEIKILLTRIEPSDGSRVIRIEFTADDLDDHEFMMGNHNAVGRKNQRTIFDRINKSAKICDFEDG